MTRVTRLRTVAGYYPYEGWWVKANSVQWPRVIMKDGRRYQMSRSMKRWRRLNRFLQSDEEPRGAYYGHDDTYIHYRTYIDVRYSQAIPEYLQVSEGL